MNNNMTAGHFHTFEDFSLLADLKSDRPNTRSYPSVYRQLVVCVDLVGLMFGESGSGSSSSLLAVNAMID